LQLHQVAIGQPEKITPSRGEPSLHLFLYQMKEETCAEAMHCGRNSACDINFAREDRRIFYRVQRCVSFNYSRAEGVDLSILGPINFHMQRKLQIGMSHIA
tara:strand:- start:228 stop:530 length:303 start_codon:yes stop_codon:yes gene_type:complete